MADPFDRLLERTMKAGASAPEACPSAEVLAAYVDGVLSLPERNAIERHAADCHTCAAHLALLSSLDEPASPSADITPTAAWWRSWTWLVPLAASVVVAAVWVSLPREAQVPTAETDRVASAERSVPEPKRPAAVPAGATPSEPSHTVNETAPAPLAAGGVAPKLRKQHVPSTATAAPAVPAAQAAASERRDQPPPPAMQAPAAPAADSAALKPQSADLKDKADEEQRQRAEAAPTAAPEGVTAPTSTVAAQAGALSAARRPKTEASFVMKSAGDQPAGVGAGNMVAGWDASGRGWRIANGVIQQTSDRGATWQDAHAPALPGASILLQVSADVCWFASPSGEVLLHASDGTWKRSRVPTTAAVTSMHATSATDAIATTEDQRRFQTKDGGATWVLLTK